MAHHFTLSLLISLGFTLCAALPIYAGAQSAEDAEMVRQGKRYLDLNLHALTKYEHRLERRQQRLLSKLSKKERRFEQRLWKKDTVAWARYKERQLSFDSIAHLSGTASSAKKSSLIGKPNPVIDSLQGVAGFITKAANKGGASEQLVSVSEYNTELSSLKGKLNYRQYINELITKRTSELKSIGNGRIAGISGIEQEVYYGKAQMSAYKGMAEDPGKLEEKAYEYLQGQAGFEESVDKAVNGNNLMTAMGGGMASAADLEKMGYQTQRQLGASLQQKFGANPSAVQQKMGSQIGEWQKAAQSIGTEIKETKQSVSNFRSTQKPSFKVNPMRCLPFSQRIEKSWDFQISRATADGKPAMMQLGGIVGYRQTPKLSAGVGAAINIGLGQSWSQIHFSFEGISLRSYASWQLVYGIGAYAGYERTYKRASSKDTEVGASYSSHNTSTYSESALLGLSKAYQINNKSKGAIQLLYDFWWKEKQQASPLVIRLSIK